MYAIHQRVGKNARPGYSPPVLEGKLAPHVKAGMGEGCARKRCGVSSHSRKADARRRILAASATWSSPPAPSDGTGCSGSRARRWRPPSSRARRSPNQRRPQSDRTRRERVRERCVLSLASRESWTSRHSSVRRSGASEAPRCGAGRAGARSATSCTPKRASPTALRVPRRWGHYGRSRARCRTPDRMNISSNFTSPNPADEVS